MQTSARTRVALSILLICAATGLEVSSALTDEADQNEPISHNCIGGDDDDADECHETEMHPNAPPMQRDMKSQLEKTTDYWLEQGVQHVRQKTDVTAATATARLGAQHARNVILFIGDGMSLATLAATRLYLGGEEQSLSFERFPHTGLARTYALDRLVPDSAAAATALLCGVKTKHGIIGLDGRAKRGSCDFTATKQSQLSSMAGWALGQQKWAGLVTTTRVTDATPAALYAHSSERMWENDADLKKVCGSQPQVPDIGLQLMTGSVGERLKVVLGGGSAQLRHEQQDSGSGLRTDGRDLINEFKTDKRNIFVSSKVDRKWLNVNLTESGRFMGLFSENDLPYHLETTNEAKLTIPSLAEMTAKAIEILSENENGFFLLVEAGKIDLAHHENKARLAVDETAQLDKAVAKALEMTDFTDTLIVVTADHGHTMSLAGYGSRSGDIFGISNSHAADDLPYKVLSYANGPSYFGFRDAKSKKRLHLNKKPKAPNDSKERRSSETFPSTAPLTAATHGGEDVPVFANGPWSHLFSGVYDQSTIPHLMAFASCLDKEAKACHGA